MRGVRKSGGAIGRPRRCSRPVATSRPATLGRRGRSAALASQPRLGGRPGAAAGAQRAARLAGCLRRLGICGPGHRGRLHARGLAPDGGHSDPGGQGHRARRACSCRWPRAAFPSRMRWTSTLRCSLSARARSTTGRGSIATTTRWRAWPTRRSLRPTPRCSTAKRAKTSPTGSPTGCSGACPSSACVFRPDRHGIGWLERRNGIDLAGAGRAACAKPYVTFERQAYDVHERANVGRGAALCRLAAL
jgi:hypothetical protein